MEVMVVLGIIALLLALGLPAFREFVVRNRLDGTAQELLASLQFARSEATRRGAQVTLVRLSGTAGSKNWSNGWAMFVDEDRDGDLDEAERPPIREGMALTPPLTLYGSGSFATFIAFDRDGRLAGDGGYFVLCEGKELTDAGRWRARAVVVNGAGRVRMAERDDSRKVLLADTGDITRCEP